MVIGLLNTGGACKDGDRGCKGGRGVQRGQGVCKGGDRGCNGGRGVQKGGGGV